MDFDYRPGHMTEYGGTNAAPPLSDGILWENTQARDIRESDSCYAVEEYQDVTDAWVVQSTHSTVEDAIRAAKDDVEWSQENGYGTPAIRVVYYREQSET